MTPAPGSRNKDGGLAGALPVGVMGRGTCWATQGSPGFTRHQGALNTNVRSYNTGGFLFPFPLPRATTGAFLFVYPHPRIFLHCSSERVERGETGRGERNSDVRRNTLIGCFPNALTTDACRPGHRRFLFLKFRVLLSSLGKNVLEF